MIVGISHWPEPTGIAPYTTDLAYEASFVLHPSTTRAPQEPRAPMASGTRWHSPYARAVGAAAPLIALSLIPQLFATSGGGQAAAASADGDRTTGASLWIGDSITAGAGSGGADFSASCLTSAAFGWTCQLDAQGGTGFVADGRANSTEFAPLGERLEESRRNYLADVIIVDAGRNDPGGPQTRRAMTAYLRALRAAWPEATVVVVIPWSPCSNSPSVHHAHLSEAAAQIGALIEDPVARGWTGPASPLCAHTVDGVHPSAEGYRLAVQSLVADLRSIGLDGLTTAADRRSEPAKEAGTAQTLERPGFRRGWHYWEPVSESTGA